MTDNTIAPQFNNLQPASVQQIGSDALPAGIQTQPQLTIVNPEALRQVHASAPQMMTQVQITESVNKLVEALKNLSRRDLQIIRGLNDPLAGFINLFISDMEASPNLKQAQAELTKLLKTLSTGTIKQALAQYDKASGQVQLISPELKAVHQAVQEALTKAQAKSVEMQRMLENKDFNEEVLNEATINYLVSLIQTTAHYQSLPEHSWIGPDKADLVNVFKTFAQHHFMELNTKNQIPQNVFSFSNSRIVMRNSNPAELNQEVERLKQAGYTVKFENGQLSAEKQHSNSSTAVKATSQVQTTAQVVTANPVSLPGLNPQAVVAQQANASNN